MKTLVILCCSFALAMPLGGQQEQTDPYSINLIRMALKLQGQGIYLSVVEKNIPRRGDQTAIALLKIFTEGELSDPKTVATFLPVIRQSFSVPEAISADADKKPDVTLMLLKHLQQNITDVQTQHLIEDTIKFVQGKASNGPK